MPVGYLFSGRLLHLLAEGSYSTDELKATLDAALRDPACTEEVRLLVDVTRSDALATRSSDDIRDTVEYLLRHGSRLGHRCAILTKTPVQHGLSRMAKTFADSLGIDSEVFQDLAKATEWLGQPKEAEPS